MSQNNPFLKKLERKDHGTKGERRASKRLGGQLTPASGAMDGAKGDFHLPTFLVESKTTEFASLSIKHEWLVKIYKEAIGRGKQPALIFQFVDGQGKPIYDGSWVAIPESVFEDIVNAQSEKRS